VLSNAVMSEKAVVRLSVKLFIGVGCCNVA
jgi:hypothetical protein